MVRCSIQTTDLELTPNMHRKQKSKVRFLKDMLSSFEYSSCHRRKTTTTTKNDPTRILKVSTYRVVCVVGGGEVYLKRLSNGCKDLGTEIDTNQACHACNKGCKNSSISAQMAKVLVLYYQKYINSNRMLRTVKWVR